MFSRKEPTIGEPSQHLRTLAARIISTIARGHPDHVPRVYLDTSALKHAIERRIEWVPRSQTINWGGLRQKLQVSEPIEVFPADRIHGDEMRREVALLRSVADLAKSGHIELIVNEETMVEFCGLPRTRGVDGLFFDAPVTRVRPPIAYGRVMYSAWDTGTDLQYQFLCRINDSRFDSLQRACGAYQGPSRPRRTSFVMRSLFGAPSRPALSSS